MISPNGLKCAIVTGHGKRKEVFVYEIDTAGALGRMKEFKLKDNVIELNPKNKFITDISFSYNGKLIMLSSEGGLEMYKLSYDAEFLSYTDVLKGKKVTDAQISKDQQTLIVRYGKKKWACFKFNTSTSQFESWGQEQAEKTSIQKITLSNDGDYVTVKS